MWIVPTFSLFLSGGWLQSQLSSVVQGGNSLLQFMVVNCSLKRERPWDKVRRRQPWVVLPVSLSHTDGV